MELCVVSHGETAEGSSEERDKEGASTKERRERGCQAESVDNRRTRSDRLFGVAVRLPVLCHQVLQDLGRLLSVSKFQAVVLKLDIKIVD